MILVVDDEPVVAHSIVAILNSFDQEFFALAATDVSEALKFVHGIRPDLVLLDVIMPRVRELEHAIEMRHQCGCSVLLISGHAATTDILHRSDLAGESFPLIAKPVHPQELVERIRQALREKPPQNAWKNPLSFQVQ